MSFEVAEPILNSPFSPPAEHWLIREGHDPEKISGRRLAGYFYRQPTKGPTQGTSEWVELQLVNLIRERVERWRREGYPGASRVTLELLAHWNDETRERPLFFAQREAAETIIFLTEARSDFLQGIDVPLDEAADRSTTFSRLACKMATGSGKTTVMAMLIAWSFANKCVARRDARFSDVALVVCPSVTIRDRLQELDPSRGEGSIYVTRGLVPLALLPFVRRGRVVIRHWRELERKGMSSGNRVQKNGVPETVTATVKLGEKTTTARGGRYMTTQALRIREMQGNFRIVTDRRPEADEVVIEETRYVESDTRLVNRILEDRGAKKNLLVFNDEAHHAYRIREQQPGVDEDGMWPDDAEAEELVHESTVWVDALDRVNALRKINFCVDLSATPYFLARAGDRTNQTFPWVVSDFGLTDAIESGLVKVPQLAQSDASGMAEPAYFNIWNWVMSKLTGSERGGKSGNPKPEAVLRYAEHPIRMLAMAWKDLLLEWESAEDEDRPPVLIVVCKNIRLAKMVHEWMGEGTQPESIPALGIPEILNTPTRTICIRVDSKVVQDDDSEAKRSDAARWMRLTLDTVGRSRWPVDSHGLPVYPPDFVELANRLNKPLFPPGRDVRCIVSVGMLTEGWDCNTVTHIVGLRPFMSQLLCEQVVGRGLRRRNYEINEKNQFDEEVAKVLGVPFEVIPFKTREGGKPKKAERTRVHAQVAKKELEITYPRVIGYVQKLRSGISIDWENIAPVKVDAKSVPDEVRLKGSLLNSGRPSLFEPGASHVLDLESWRRNTRLQSQIFEMAGSLTRAYALSPSCEIPSHVLFPILRLAVERFVREKVLVSSPEKVLDVFLAPYWGYVIERLRESIVPDASSGDEPETVSLDPDSPLGSTSEVDFWTIKSVVPILRSHVNLVVIDSPWEAAAAHYLDNHSEVLAFVKNQGLGLRIPYVHAEQAHDYIPDFVVLLRSGERLLLETKGYDEKAEIKVQAAQRWVSAVNASEKLGKWHYKIAYSVDEVQTILDAVPPSADS